MSDVNEGGSSHDERSMPEALEAPVAPVAPEAPEAHDAPSPTVTSTSTPADVTPPAAAIPSTSTSSSATPSTSTTSLAASPSEVNTSQAAPTIAASTSTSTSTSTPSKTINLRVLSPALELSGGLHLGAVAVDTTIGALRYKISEQASIQASISALPDNQRLIYCGRALVNNADTLENIFGSAQLQQQSDFTIHLVLRQHVGPAPNSGTPVAQSRSHTPLPPGGRRTSTANNAAAPQLPRPAVAGAPPFPNFARPAIPPIPGIPGIPGLPLGQVPGFMIPPQLPGMHLHPHHHHPHAHPPHPPSTPRSPQPPQSAHGTPPPGQDQPRIPGLQLPQLPQLPANGTTRVINGPDGTRYTVRVNSSTITFPASAHHHHHHPNPAQLPQFAALQQQLQPNFNPFIQPQLAFAQHPHRATPPPANFDVNDAFDDPVTANDVQELARLTSDFARLMQAEPGISDQARQAAQALRGNTEAIASRLAERRTAPAMSHNQTTPSAQQQQPANTQHFDATAATVYLLSSPAGPQALLFAPQGTYTGQPMHVAGLPTMPGFSTAPQTAHFGAQPPMAPVRQPTPANANPGLPDPPLNMQPGQAVAQLPGAQLPGEQEVRELVRQFNQERQNPPADVLAQWQPVLAQFWLLFRVMLFAYFFFPTDQGWYRPLAMAFVCLAFWLLNGDGPGRGVRDAVRSWWEGVVGIPARRGAPRPGAQADPPVVQPAQQQPEPELHWLRQTFRPIERALALFVASFWPGIGERTVAARRAEEERQRREEQERITAANEEAARRESAENETLNASAAPETEDNNDTSSMFAEAGSAAGEQEATSTTTRGTATGAQVGSAEVLRDRKTVSRAATVEEEKNDDATATQAASSDSQIEQ